MSHRALVLLWSLCVWGALAVNENSTEALAANDNSTVTVRLAGGASRCEGAVELKYRGEWRPATANRFLDRWDLQAAASVCRDLECGSAVSTEERPDFNRSDVWSVRTSCWKRRADVRSCVRDNSTDSSFALGLVCSDSVRLVSGRSQCSGYLQIRDQSSNQSWTSVCEGALDRRGAEVLCRDLGCGAPLLQGELSPLGEVFHCEGNESALMDCPRNQTRTDPGTCSGSDLNITCSEPLRLVRGTSRCDGIVELEIRAEWRPVVIFNGFLDQETADVLCRGLDCGSAVSAVEMVDYKLRSVWSVRPDCVKEKSAVKDCAYADYTNLGLLQLVCSGNQGAPEENQRLP